MRLLSSLLCACLLCACQSAPRIRQAATLTVSPQRYDCAMETVSAMLRDRGFKIERFDRRSGVVAAAPEGIPTSGELWHGNTSNLGPWEARANLQDLRHRVRFTLAPTPEKQPGDAYLLQAQVIVERLDTPTRQINASFANPAYSLKEVPEHWRMNGMEDSLWQAIGQDGDLEQRLIADVAERLNQNPSVAPDSKRSNF